ncbi:deleted in malignant brain tumors 1 protein-like [Latimeria chalumnae]|uniref:deleted in malignant brain tumors 1 protein-like n=1 Tax=Latimeria chalumnae TaxID=7897 RepID=UPI00313ABAE9
MNDYDDCKAFRLVGGKSFCDGRVTVFYDTKWQPICNNGPPGWKNEVCQHLGCGKEKSSESLHTTASTASKNTKGIKILKYLGTPTGCQHVLSPSQTCNPATVICEGLTTKLGFRLEGGRTACEGRVALFNSTKWLPFCNNLGPSNWASEVCQHLGCGGVLDTEKRCSPKLTKQGLQNDTFTCNKKDGTLEDCLHYLTPAPSCKQAEVICEESKPNLAFRLEGGRTFCEGRVTLFNDSKWLPVCHSTGFRDLGTEVCRYLGCGELKENVDPEHFPKSSQETAVTCSKSECKLGDCLHHLIPSSTCPEAAVICKESKPKLAFRLEGGRTLCEGRVTLFHKAKWLPVCNNTGFRDLGTEVCRYIGCGELKENVDPKHFPKLAQGRHKEKAVTCSESGWKPEDCLHRLKPSSRCTEAAVVCKGQNNF